MKKIVPLVFKTDFTSNFPKQNQDFSIVRHRWVLQPLVLAETDQDWLMPQLIFPVPVLYTQNNAASQKRTSYNSKKTANTTTEAITAFTHNFPSPRKWKLFQGTRLFEDSNSNGETLQFLFLRFTWGSNMKYWQVIYYTQTVLHHAILEEFRKLWLKYIVNCKGCHLSVLQNWWAM